MDEAEVGKPTDENDVAPEDLVGFGQQYKKKKTGQETLEESGAEIKYKAKTPSKAELEDTEFGPKESQPTSSRKSFFSDTSTEMKTPSFKDVKEGAKELAKEVQEKGKVVKQKYQKYAATGEHAPSKGISQALKMMSGQVQEQKGGFFSAGLGVTPTARPTLEGVKTTWKKNIEKSFAPEEQKKPLSERERAMEKLFGPSREERTQQPTSTWGKVSQGLGKSYQQMRQADERARRQESVGQRAYSTPSVWRPMPAQQQQQMPNMFPPQQFRPEDEYRQYVQERAPFRPGFPFAENVPMGLSPYQKRGPGLEDLRRQAEQEYLMKEQMKQEALMRGEEWVDESKLPLLGGTYTQADGTQMAKRVPAYRPVTLKASFVIRPLIGKPRRFESYAQPRRQPGTVLMMGQTRESGSIPQARMPASNAGFRYVPFAPVTFKFTKPMGVQALGMRTPSMPFGLSRNMYATEEVPAEPEPMPILKSKRKTKKFKNKKIKIKKAKKKGKK